MKIRYLINDQNEIIGIDSHNIPGAVESNNTVGGLLFFGHVPIYTLVNGIITKKSLDEIKSDSRYIDDGMSAMFEKMI